MIETQKRLYDLGFAIHLLYPKQKRPYEKKWTSGPRKTWAELTAAYRVGDNVGVRLGLASRIGEAFLASIDCDVVSTVPEHLAEMEAAIDETFKSDIFRTSAPCVYSGRGNGSRHIYIRTAHPVKARPKLRQSKFIVAVKTSGKERPNAKEMARFTPKELNEGMRLRPAWTIALYGEGQQFVLPPSIHPITGNAYTWKNAPGKVNDIPLFDIALLSAETASTENVEAINEFDFVEVDLFDGRIPNWLVDQLVKTPEGDVNYSDKIFGIAVGLCKSGLSDTEIVSILTDQTLESGFGDVGFNHAKTESRQRAARWIMNYTIKKARSETNAAGDFASAVVVSDKLPDDLALKQSAEIILERDWRDSIDRYSPQSGGRPKPTMGNALLILSNHFGAGLFRYDEFYATERYGQLTPWGGRLGSEVTDQDVTAMKAFILDQYRVELPKERIHEAIQEIGRLNKFHPVRDYLKGLVWDGKPRVSTWLRDYLEAEGPESYVTAVSRKILVAMVARVMNPGAKFDQVPILEGLQGIGKSTALKELAGEWFTDALPSVTDKDAIMQMQGIWLVELGELSTMTRADVDAMKAFISRPTDRVRVPYGRKAENFPRQCVFVGTTNGDEYLKDTTGNRRFWPVTVGRYKFGSLIKGRDQLFAEAMALYEVGEPLYLENTETANVARSEQAKREISDAWDGVFADWVEKQEKDTGKEVDEIRMHDLFGPFGPFETKNMTSTEMQRAGAVLRRFYFIRKSLWRKGVKTKLWVKNPQKGE